MATEQAPARQEILASPLNWRTEPGSLSKANTRVTIVPL
jgi:hypothetical protein